MKKSTCGRCLTSTTITQKGRDTVALHDANGKMQCPPFSHCPVQSPIHKLADGKLCPDERHTNQ